jgi:hypothetical protein
MWHAWERTEKCTKLWRKSRRTETNSEDRGANERMVLEWFLGRLASGVWSGFTWLRKGNAGGLLWMRWWTFGFWHHCTISLSVGAMERVWVHPAEKQMATPPQAVLYTLRFRLLRFVTSQVSVQSHLLRTQRHGCSPEWRHIITAWERNDSALFQSTIREMDWKTIQKNCNLIPEPQTHLDVQAEWEQRVRVH